jgi:hypothetical protein
MLRRYATVSAKPVSRLRARGKSPLGLENVCSWRNYIHLLTMQTDTGGQFIQRQKVLALWRDIVRSINNIPDASTRSDMRRFARDEFQQHRNVSDLVSSSLQNHAQTFHQQAANCIQGHIRYLLSVRRLPFHFPSCLCPCC